MSTIQGFIQTQMAQLKDAADKVAHGVANGMGYDDYLINVGKYRALKAQANSLKDRLKAMHTADAASMIADDDDDEEELPQTTPPAREPRRRQRKARAWGGDR